jgi:hypothetical protein
MMLEKGTRRPVVLTSRADGPAAVGAAAVDWLRYPNDLVIVLRTLCRIVSNYSPA